MIVQMLVADIEATVHQQFLHAVLSHWCTHFWHFTQEMRTHGEAEQAGKDCGFKLVLSYDVATASPVCGPW